MATIFMEKRQNKGKGDIMDIYFIQIGNDGPIKIGRTRDVGKRIRSLQTGHHRELKVVHVESPPKGESLRAERQFHSTFKDLRIRGEWFRPGPAILDYIGKSPLTWEKIAALDEDLVHLYQDALITGYGDGNERYHTTGIVS